MTQPMIQTHSGLEVNPFSLTHQEISIEDIAHSLSQICRFNGHTLVFYSVAQHCIEVAKRMKPDVQLYGLLHECEEAYLTDLITPIKYQAELSHYRENCLFLKGVIYNKFGLSTEEPVYLKEIDKKVCVTESRDLMHHPLPGEAYPEKIVPLSSKEAKKFFLSYFHQLENNEDISSVVAE